MIRIETNIEKSIAYLDKLGNRIASGELVQDALEKAITEGRRFAVAISPVDTGSYKASHAITMGENWATLSIDPAARNRRTGVPVTEYAGAVEGWHQVYGRTAAHVGQLAGPFAVELVRSFAE